MIERHVFRAMGTDVELLLDGEPRDAPGTDAFGAVEREFERLEAILSRFLPESELSRLNRDGRIEAGPDLLHVVTLALEARVATDGLFDPTIHDAVVAAGYDRSFDELPADGPGNPLPAHRAGEVLVTGRTIELSGGTRLDLGGIGKGYAVDRACELLAMSGPCLVNAGGDLAVRGGAWPVGAGGVTLLLESGAIATSGRDRRRWQRGGEERHHLIDPRTGRPADTTLLSVTVVAASAAEAEVLAKVAFLGGTVDAPRILVTADGTATLAGGLS
jgi:thiamine biosynthesis lipoprotein